MRLPQHVLLVLSFALAAYAAILGIDLGQDFTKAVVVAPGVPFEIVMSSDSKRKDVTGLAIKPIQGSKDKDDIERTYGSATNSLVTRFPQNCLLNYKALLGRSMEDPLVQRYISTHPGVELSSSRRQTTDFKVGSQSYPAEEVLAMNLQDITTRAAAILKEKSPGGYSQIDDVAITVPAYYTEQQRDAVRDAAYLAGFKNTVLVDDGVAVATNFATNREFEVGVTEKHVIYDMGAGATKATFVSFLKPNATEPLKITVEGYAYDETLGGSSFTSAVADLIKAQFLQSQPKMTLNKLQGNNRSMAKINQAAEKAKLVLSANNEAYVSIESVYEDIDFKGKVTREQFEEYVNELGERVTLPILESLSTANQSLDDINSVIFVGGSTRVPFVQQHLTRFLGDELISKTINSDEAAVFGTTLRGVQLTKMFKAKDFNVADNSIFNYRTIFNDNEDEESVVFAKGSPYNLKKELNITDKLVPGEDLPFDTLENTRILTHYTIPSQFKLTLNETECITPLNYFAKFELSESRVFKLQNVEARCNVTETKISKSVVHYKTEHISSKPLSVSAKQELKNHLHSLNTKDSQRKLISERLNDLEGILYRTKAYLDELEDDEEIKNNIEGMLLELNEVTSGYLEWLDYDSEGATLKDIKEKIKHVNELKNEIEKFVSNSAIPLNVDLFETLNDIIDDTLKTTEEIFSSSLQKELDLASQFNQAGLNITKEITRLTKASQNVPFKPFEQSRERVVSLGQEISELINLDGSEFSQQDKSELFKLRENVIDSLQELTETKEKFTKSHEQKLKELNRALVRGIRAKKRAEEKAKEKADAKGEVEVDQEEVFEDAQEVVMEENVHDEL